MSRKTAHVYFIMLFPWAMTCTSEMKVEGEDPGASWTGFCTLGVCGEVATWNQQNSTETEPKTCDVANRFRSEWPERPFAIAPEVSKVSDRSVSPGVGSGSLLLQILADRLTFAMKIIAARTSISLWWVLNIVFNSIHELMTVDELWLLICHCLNSSLATPRLGVWGAVRRTRFCAPQIWSG